jgi:protein Mpv17
LSQIIIVHNDNNYYYHCYIYSTASIVLIAVAVLNQVATVDANLMRGWTAQEMAVRIPVDNWQSYSAVLEKSPLATKAITSATVYTIGDFIAQRTEGVSMGALDRWRLLRSLLAGLVGHGPLSHVWYDISEDVFENVLHLRDWWGTIVKVAIDQTTWGPFWNNTYILLLGLMKMEKLENIWGEMKRTTIPLIVSGLKLWPLAHCITYGLIPVENRLLWVDLVEIIWVTILATAAAGGSASDGPPNETTEHGQVPSKEQQQQQQQQQQL